MANVKLARAIQTIAAGTPAKPQSVAAGEQFSPSDFGLDADEVDRLIANGAIVEVVPEEVVKPIPSASSAKS